MSLSGIEKSARSLSYYLRLQEVTAHNLANAGTDAFKAAHLAAQSAPDGEGIDALQSLDMGQGALKETGRTLDIAIEGAGFLVARTAQGERLTRGGSLTIDAEGMLIDSHGDPILGSAGPLFLNGSAIDIARDGTVLVDGISAGKLRLDSVEDLASLVREGNGRFVPSTPLIPVDEETAAIRQGAVEQSNCDPIHSLVDLVTIQRAYAANIDAMKALDGVLGVTNDLGRV